MSSGLLFYRAADAVRNRWFIQQLSSYAESEGCSLRLCLAEDGFPQDCTPDLVLNRSRDPGISRFCDDTLHIPVYNRTAVTEITNDKFTTHRFLRAHGIPTADTLLVTEGMACPAVTLPCVAKPTDGHGGQGVTWVADEAALHRVMKEMPRPFLLQKPMVTGWDMRVYVLFGEVYAAMLRTSAADFRSNFSLGGSAAPVTPDADVLALVHRVQQLLPMHFAGVDLLRHPDGGYVIGEIEDAVGCRMLYQYTHLDPARDLISRLLRAQ